MRVPLPPGYKVLVNEAPTQASGALTENEADIIFKTTLRPEHRDDPNVLRFISNYMRCRDARQAAKEAGLTPNSGTVLRNRPDIHDCIEKLTLKSVQKYGYDATEVIERVKEIAGIDPIEFENPDGTYKTSLAHIAPETRRAIKKFKCKNIFETDPNGMKIVVGQLIEVELWNKMHAIELLGKEKEIFKQKTTVEHDLSNRMADILLESKQRADTHVSNMIDVTPPKQIAPTESHE